MHKKCIFCTQNTDFSCGIQKKVVPLHRDFGIRHITAFGKYPCFHGCAEVLAARV